MGWISVAIPRYVEESCPPHIYSAMSPIFTINYALGNLTAMCSGLILPKDDDVIALATTTRWRWIFGFPFPLSVLIFFYLLWGFRCESPKFYLMKNDEIGAHISISKIYSTSCVEEIKAIATYLKTTI